MQTKDLEYYNNLHWTYTIKTSSADKQEKLYIVHVNELPGVCTDAPTLAEAMDSIKEAMTGAFNLYLKQGEEIPEPINEEEFQGIRS